MTRLKDLTFESGATTGSDAFTSVTGSPTIDTSGKIKGPNSFRCNWAAASNVYGRCDFTASSPMYVSFYLVLGAAPAATFRLLNGQNSVSQFDVRLTATPTIQFRNGGSTLYTSPTLSTNTIYRFGIYYKCETTQGVTTDGVMEVYSASGDDDFGAYKARNGAITMATSNAGLSRIDFGMSNAASASGDLYFDDIRIDDAIMPGASLALPKPFVAFSPIIRM